MVTKLGKYLFTVSEFTKLIKNEILKGKNNEYIERFLKRIDEILTNNK